MPKINWFNDRFNGTSIIELSEGDNLGDNDGFLMILVGSITSPKVSPTHAERQVNIYRRYQFVHSCFTGHYPSFSFQVSEEHHKLKRVYIVCLIGLCAPPGVATGGNVGEVWILQFTLGFKYRTPKYWKLDLPVSGFQMAYRMSPNWSDVLMLSKKRQSVSFMDVLGAI